MRQPLHPSAFVLAAVLAAALAATAAAQTETDLLTIAQTGIGSNGFGTAWRGQDVELTEDAWLTRIVFQTGSATANVDEIRLMTAVPQPTTLRTVTSVTALGTEIEAVLAEPWLLRAGTRYTVWFHQTGSARGTYGCDLTRIDPTWGAYHTNVDPTQAPAIGEPSYYWGYQYGTNLRLVGFDNLEITGNPAVGGSATITLETPPNDIAFVLFGLGTADLPFAPFTGPLRLDPALLLPASFAGSAGPSGVFSQTLAIPGDPSLSGAVLHLQGLHDANFSNRGRFSPLESLTIR